MLWRSTLRFDSAVICALGSAVPNSLRALRPLRSNKGTEHDNVSRYARSDPRAQITAESKRSVDRHSMSPGRLAPDATRDTYRMKRSATH